MMNPAEFANIAAMEESFWWFRGMRRVLCRLLDPIAGEGGIERVLEAGCGTGHLSRFLQQRYNWRMIPTDLAMEGLAHGRSLGVDGLTQANISQLPFANNSFDAVLSMDVLVHFARGMEGPAFAELVRVLKPGGLLVIRVSALDILRSRHSQFAQERQRFTRSRLLARAREHRLHVLRSTYCNSLLLPVTLAKFRLYEPFLKSPPDSGVSPVPAWLDNLLYMPLALEAQFLQWGLNFPLGQSLLLLAKKPR